MAKILYATSFGSDDPTRATIPFIAATGAIQAGHQPEIALLGEATYLVKTGMAEQIQGVGFPPLTELFSKLIEHRIPVYVWGLCGKARGVSEDELNNIGARFISPAEFAEVTVAADRVVTVWTPTQQVSLQLAAARVAAKGDSHAEQLVADLRQ
jgi:predicted peroxiredoxin